MEDLQDIAKYLEDKEKFEFAGIIYTLMKYLEELEENDSDYEPDEYGCVEEDLQVNVDEQGFYSLA